MSAIEGLGGVQKALLAALDQMGAAISSFLEANPDMVFLHQSPGLPVDPKRYANPWTPDGGDVYSLMADGGEIKMAEVAKPPPPPEPAPGAKPSNKPQPPPPPDPHASAAINSAVSTAHLANQNLQLGTPIASYGLGTVADAWKLIAPATFADPPPPVPQSQLDAIKKAMALLYVRPGVPTQGFRDYRKARDTVTNLIGAKAAAFVAAMGDPFAAASWPLSQGKMFDQQIQDAETDRNAVDLSAGDMSYSDAEAFIDAQGKDIVTSAVEAVHKRWELFGETSAQVGQFAYTSIDPPSWCLSNDQSFGVMQISVSDSTYDAGSSSEFGDFSSSYYHSSSQSDTGGVGIVYGPFSATGDFGYSSANSDEGFSTSSSASSTDWDQSSSASISGEFFLATIDRPWLFDEIFRIASGWHIKDRPTNFLSDGTKTAGNNKNWMPVLPVQMLVARNIAISCDDWGHFSSFATNFAASASSQDESSGLHFGGSVGAFGLGGTYHHDDQSTDGSQFSSDDGSSGWSFQSSESGGTLSIHGTQILGWIARVIPASPPS
ncbi:hypothetical protein ABT052_47075 [Streptomyces sp. NPDC002766]|uniref:hypothetical protein n=1 Tax=Streptomyces sp. NPDC002766 TaxID=3154429 RepID=UPI00332EF03B